MSNLWPFNTTSSDAAERFIDASHALGDMLRDTSTRVAHGASTGLDQARVLADDALARSRSLARSTRGIVEERPVEALLLVAVAAFAIGWVLRPIRRATRVVSARPARARARPRSARSS